MGAQAGIDLRIGRHPARSSPSVGIVIVIAHDSSGADNMIFAARDRELQGADVRALASRLTTYQEPP
jgi:hypothetical protein